MGSEEDVRFCEHGYVASAPLRVLDLRVRECEWFRECTDGYKTHRKHRQDEVQGVHEE